MHTDKIKQLLGTARSKIDDARAITAQVPETLGAISSQEIESALNFVTDALNGDELDLRGNIAAAYSRLWQTRFPRDEHQRLFGALADLRDCLMEIDETAASSDYPASEASIKLPPNPVVVERLPIKQELATLEKSLNELDYRLQELAANKSKAPNSSFQDAIIDTVTAQASAKSVMAHNLMSQPAIDIKGLAHIVEGIGRIIEAFQETVAPIKARVSAGVRKVAQGLSSVARRVMQAGAAVVRKASQPTGAATTEVSFLVRDGDSDRKEKRMAGAGVSFQDCWLQNGRRVCGPEMVVLPAGSFLMGSTNGTGERSEQPQHMVIIPRPFAVGKHPVTFAEWDLAVEAGGVAYVPDADWGRGAHPVTRVSWQDTQEYIAWLSRTTGKRYRLLSEAEWEYACRAGTTTAYSFGDTITTQQAHFSQSTVLRAVQTSEVGSYPENSFGLHDMHGNVLEWCEDVWNEDYSAKPGKLNKTGGPWTTGDYARRVLRGGSWYGSAGYLRSASRKRDSKESRGNYLGFRVARDLD